MDKFDYTAFFLVYLFSLLDHVFKLFSYENRKKKYSQAFFFPAFEAYENVKLHFITQYIPRKMKC